jgi:serine/threonine-protein kinase RsbT
VAVLSRASLEIRTADDVVRVRQAVRDAAIRSGFGLVDQTRLVTAASELARNTLIHGRGGSVALETLNDMDRTGVRMTFVDKGPGIPDVEVAMRDGYTTTDGLGIGLGGARRLVTDFSIESGVGQGTRVIATRWTWKRP